MNKQKVDNIITEYLPRIYGFALEKAFSYDEADDLGGDIIQEVYLSLLNTKELSNPDGYIWRTCTHVYAKYVARKKKHQGVSIDDLEIPFYEPFDSLLEDTKADIARLRREIAFLTKSRREIIYLFYYENRSISYIAECLNMPEGTVKWHLNKARNELKEGYAKERKIGTLGISPITAKDLGHSGIPDPDGRAADKYLEDKLNLNIVYSVYYEPRTPEEISEELGVTPVFLEDRIRYLEANGFLVRTAGGRFTTYTYFLPRTYSREQKDVRMKAQQEAARILAAEYVPLVRQAVAQVKDVYIPGGNRELLEAAAVFYGIKNKSMVIDMNWSRTLANSAGKEKNPFSPESRNLSKYYVHTLAGGDFIPWIALGNSPLDPEYQSQFRGRDFTACGDMNRFSAKYPLSSWAVDTKFCSRTGTWINNPLSDYEYLYEFIKGDLPRNAANADKYERLITRGYLSEDGAVNIIVVKDTYLNFFEKIPALGQELKEHFTRQALEYAMMEAKNYPPQMQDLIISIEAYQFIGNTAAIMVLDILYENGTFKPLTDREKVTSQLIMFSDILP